MPAGASWVGGLDMCGNVDEWVEDCWHDSYEGAPADGSAWTVDCGGENRPGRGGAWWESFGRGTADRVGWRPDYRSGGLGARCARDLP